MSLDNEERTSQMIESSHKIVDLSRDLRELTLEIGNSFILKRVVSISELCEKIPHALYGKRSDGSYWILGGELENPVRGHNGPWSSAIIFQCEEHRPEDPHEFHFKKDSSFNVMTMFTEEGLLPQLWQKTAYRLFSNLEHLTYALHRYDDKFLRKFNDLNEIVSGLHFEMFNLFNSTEDFAKSYVASRIFDDLFSEIKFVEPIRGEGAEEDPEVTRLREDPLFQLIRNTGAIHSIYGHVCSGAKEASLTRMIELDRFRLSMERTLENKVILLMRISGRHLHYDHIIKGMLKLLSGKVDEEKIWAEFQECRKAARDHNELERKLYSYSGDEELEVVHGWWKPEEE